MTTETSRTVTVGRPTAAVAEYILDFTSTEWDPHTASCERLDDGPLRVGARFENVQRLLGRETPMRYTVVAYEPGRRTVNEGGTDDVRTRDEITVHGHDDGSTSITYGVSIDLSGEAELAAPLLPVALAGIAADGERRMREVQEQRLRV